MKQTIKKVKYLGRDCVEISDGKVSAIVTTEIGPRIIFYGFTGGFNHIAVLDAYSDPNAAKSEKFQGYGGHRIWHAPEHPERTYLPDNSKVEFKIVDDAAVFTQKCEASGIVKKLRLEFLDDNKLAVAQKLVNTNMFPIKCSVWGITQFAKGGVLAAPHSKVNAGLISNRALSLWSYTDMTDPRVHWGKHFVTVKHDEKNAKPFKFGMTCDEEYAAYFNNDELVIKHFPYIKDAEYPNFSCNFESYTNDLFVESESLSPLEELEGYGGELELEDIWEIFADVKTPNFKDEDWIAGVLDAHISSFGCGCGCEEDCDCEECDDDDCDCGCTHHHG